MHLSTQSARFPLLLAAVFVAAVAVGCFRSGYKDPPAPAAFDASGEDAGEDAGFDAGVDASPGVDANVSPDASISVDASEDAGIDAGGPTDAGIGPDCSVIAPGAVIADTTAPVVQLVSPADGALVAGLVGLAVDASDDVHLAGVRFWLGPAQLGAMDTAAPFYHQIDTNSLRDGVHAFSAEARDAAGNAQIIFSSFTVDNGSPISGTTYHVCDCATGADPDCVPGDDAADGLSPSTPWRTSSAASQLLETLACGESLRFCRGGVIESAASYLLPVLACANTPVRIGAYTPSWANGDEARPLLRQTSNRDGIVLRDNAGPIWGVVIEDLHLACAGCTRGDSTWGLAVINAGVVDVAIRRNEIEGFDWGMYMTQSGDVILSYNHFHHNLRAAVAAGGPGFNIRNNLFDNNGCIGAASDDACAADWSVFVGFAYDDAQLQISGNEITRTAVDSQGRCRGVALQINGGSNGALIVGNHIHEPVDGIREGCSGIEAIANGDGSAGGCDGCSINGNRIENMAAGIAVLAHRGSVVANNLISLPAAPSTSTPCAGITVLPRLDGVDVITSELVIINNSIFIAREDAGCYGLRVADTGSGHIVANNAILYSGSETSFDCLRYDAPGVVGFSGHNVCAAPAAPAARWVATGAFRLDLAAWQSQGQGLGSIQAAPGFTGADAPVYTFVPVACDWTLRDRGLDEDCPDFDHDGVVRPAGAACDIGAYER